MRVDLEKNLKENSYPGRGIVIGRSADGNKIIAAYFIMGRSENSRNRVFEDTEDGIRTKAFDPDKLTDPSLVIYRPVRVFGGKFIVTNGDQTDTIRDALAAGGDFRQALLTRCFEPDPPNYTPRISGIVTECGGYKLSILKSHSGDPSCCCRYFFEYDAPLAGTGHFIHTYEGDGDPLPSFEGEPKTVGIPDDYLEFGDAVWDALNEENKVSLYVCEIEPGGKIKSRIYNKNRQRG